MYISLRMNALFSCYKYVKKRNMFGTPEVSMTKIMVFEDIVVVGELVRRRRMLQRLVFKQKNTDSVEQKWSIVSGKPTLRLCVKKGDRSFLS